MSVIVQAAPAPMFDMTALSALVRKALTEFVDTIQTTHSVVVKDECWSMSGCQVVLKTGPRAGHACGKALAAGKSTCPAHGRTPAPITGGASTGGATPSQAVKATPVFRKTAHGNYAFEGLVVSRTTKMIVGVELPDGKIGPLSVEDKRKVVSWGLKVEEAPAVVEVKGPAVVPKEETKEETDAPDVPEEVVEEEIVEEVVEEEPIEDDEDGHDGHDHQEEDEDDAETIPVA